MVICKSESVIFNNLVINGKKTTRHFWKIPHSIANPEGEVEDEEEEEYKPLWEDLSEEFKDEFARDSRSRRNELEIL